MVEDVVVSRLGSGETPVVNEVRLAAIMAALEEEEEGGVLRKTRAGGN